MHPERGEQPSLASLRKSAPQRFHSSAGGDGRGGHGRQTPGQPFVKLSVVTGSAMLLRQPGSLGPAAVPGSCRRRRSSGMQSSAVPHFRSAGAEFRSPLLRNSCRCGYLSHTAGGGAAWKCGDVCLPFAASGAARLQAIRISDVAPPSIRVHLHQCIQGAMVCIRSGPANPRGSLT